MPGVRARRDKAGDGDGAGGAGSRSRRRDAVRGKPSPEARLLTLAIANHRGHGLRAHNTEAKVMRPNDQVERRAALKLAEQKP